jgi:hypothetical protein
LVCSNHTHTCGGGCGGGCCSNGGRREDEKDLAIGMEKEKVDELLFGIVSGKKKKFDSASRRSERGINFFILPDK